MPLKICRLSIESQPISYLCLSPPTSTPVISASSSSYHTPSNFLTLSAKYKLLVLEASEFVSLTESNPELDLFFYLKHYVKNIKDFKKEEYPKVFLPRVRVDEVLQHSEMGEVINRGLLTLDQVGFGDRRMESSIRMEPHYKDLVVKCPFIMCVLSGRLERAASGTPLYGRLVTAKEVL